MLAFFNEPSLKAQLLLRLEGHRQADEIIQGQYWDQGKGCFIGCAIHGKDEMKFEEQFGIRSTVAKLGEYFFESFSADKARALPIEIMESMPVGADSSLVWPRFWHWLVADQQHGLLGLPLQPHIIDLLRRVDLLYMAWPTIDIQAAEAAAQEAAGAARAAGVTAEAEAAAAQAAAQAAAGAARAVMAARAAAGAAGAAAWAGRSAMAAGESSPIDILSIQYDAFLSIIRGLEAVDENTPAQLLANIATEPSRREINA